MENKNVLVIIDPQNDFMDSPNFTGSLAVPGAYNDMLKIVDKIKNQPPTDIVITLDTHQEMDIAHPAWWINNEGENPPPFTLITKNDLENGTWKAVDNSLQEYSVNYVKQLSSQNKYELRIWPYHCIKGTEGHEVEENLKQALIEWEKNTGKKVSYFNKGENPKTEHYSGFKAEVVLEGEEDTYLNIDLIKKLNQYDVVEFSGEASTHCVKGTVLDYIDNIPVTDIKKVKVYKDLMSPVTGFENQATDFFDTIMSKGANVIEASNPNKKLKV